MERQEHSRRRKGAIPETQLDGSITLYGVEDWTQVRDDPVFLEMPCADGEEDSAGEPGTARS
jgi:hypothetical protein